MSRNKKEDKHPEMTFRFVFDEDGSVGIINPATDPIPLGLFCLVLEKVVEAQREWNEKKSHSGPSIRSMKE